MSIPEARQALLDLKKYIVPEGRTPREIVASIDAILPLLNRKPAKRKATATARGKLDDTSRRLMAMDAYERPEVPLRDIGAEWGVDGARVSEALEEFYPNA
jgi:hypothetical protein